MDIVDLLATLIVVHDITIVSAAREPEVRVSAPVGKPRQNRSAKLAPASQDTSREWAFDGRQRLSDILPRAGAEQEMHMFRHDHPRGQLECLSLLRSGELVDKGVFDHIVLEERQTAKAREREIMSVPGMFDRASTLAMDHVFTPWQ